MEDYIRARSRFRFKYSGSCWCIPAPLYWASRNRVYTPCHKSGRSALMEHGLFLLVSVWASLSLLYPSVISASAKSFFWVGVNASSLKTVYHWYWMLALVAVFFSFSCFFKCLVREKNNNGGSLGWLRLTNHNVFSLVLSARPKGGLWRVTHEWRPRYQGYVLSLLHWLSRLVSWVLLGLALVVFLVVLLIPLRLSLNLSP